jgi:hypothetical protein
MRRDMHTSTAAHHDGPAGTCFHPADEPRSQVPGSVSPCFHPDDDSRDGDAAASHDPNTGGYCFHPGDGDALAESATAGVYLCHHPADDLAADLHLSLTGIDERHLAGLARSRP